VIDARQRLDGFARGLADEFAAGGDPVPVLLARIAAADTDGTTVELFSRAMLGEPRTIRLATAGRHNVANALGVVAAARALDLPAEAVLAGTACCGVGRASNGRAGGRRDRARRLRHHPTVIPRRSARCASAAGRRLWGRTTADVPPTAAMLDDFAAVLAPGRGCSRDICGRDRTRRWHRRQARGSCRVAGGIPVGPRVRGGYGGWPARSRRDTARHGQAGGRIASCCSNGWGRQTG
jgi:hypothetical protein